jgi:hypothetical protein
MAANPSAASGGDGSNPMSTGVNLGLAMMMPQMMANMMRDPALNPTVNPTGASAVPPAADPVAKLKQLKELLDAGVISKEEFDAKKSEWMSRM